MLGLRLNTRSGRAIRRIDKIILHDPGNNQNMEQVIAWFENPKNERFGSYHEIIQGSVSEILIPANEIAYHAGTFADTGVWSEPTKNGTQNLFAYGLCFVRPELDLGYVAQRVWQLVRNFGLDPRRDVFTHAMIDPGKTDPIVFQDRAVWEKFLSDVAGDRIWLTS